MLTPIKTKRVPDLIFEQIKDLIDNGDLKPGSRLMPERELSEAMCVSRTAVREAIQKLKSLNLVVQYQGRGTFVKDMDKDVDFNCILDAKHIFLNDFLEIRLGFECQAAALAARRSTRDDIEKMQNSIQTMIKHFERKRFSIHADIGFHRAIAVAAKNPLHEYIDKILKHQMKDSIHRNIKRLGNRSDIIPTIINQHQEIFECIRKRQEVKASDAMKQHITFVSDVLSKG